MELDRMIEEMRVKAKQKNEQDLKAITELRMRQLSVSQTRKQDKLTQVFEKEIQDLEDKIMNEEIKLKTKQESSFLAMLEVNSVFLCFLYNMLIICLCYNMSIIYIYFNIQANSRRALGRTKKCTCDKAYVCRHNKTASYNTRRPVYKV